MMRAELPLLPQCISDWAWIRTIVASLHEILFHGIAFFSHAFREHCTIKVFLGLSGAFHAGNFNFEHQVTTINMPRYSWPNVFLVVPQRVQ